MGKQALGLVAPIIVGAAAIVLGACSSSSKGSTAVTDSGYDTSCTADDDCVGVHFGDVCGMCAFPNASINSSAEGAYQNAVNAAQSNCPHINAGGFCVGDDSTITTCSMGKCTLATCPKPTTSAHACTSTSVSDGGVGDGGPG